jgi:hypothetical protein
MIIPFWAKALALALVIGGFSWFWYDKGYDARDLEVKTEQLATIEELTKQKQAKEAELRDVSQKLQDALRDVRVEVVYVDRVTRREIEKPVYSQCVVPESGGILINQNAERFNQLREPVR